MEEKQTFKMLDSKGRVILIARSVGKKVTCSFLRYPDMSQEEIDALKLFLEELKGKGAVPKEENALDPEAMDRFLRYEEEAEEFCG